MGCLLHEVVETTSNHVRTFRIGEVSFEELEIMMKDMEFVASRIPLYQQEEWEPRLRNSIIDKFKAAVSRK